MRNLVYITGSGRSGSTLLDMLFSTHPEIAALGEAHRFSINIGKSSVPFRCTCGEVMTDCQFWRSVIDRLTSEGLSVEKFRTAWPEYDGVLINTEGNNIVEDRPPKTLLGRIDLFSAGLAIGLTNSIRHLSAIVPRFKEGIKISRNSWHLFELISEIHRKEVIVDGTKSPGRLLSLMAFNEKNIPLKIIYLLRDGRAVTHARMHRQNLPMEYCAKAWVAEHKKISLALRQHKGEILNVKYENLCRDTVKELTRIFDYIEVSRKCNFSSFRDCSHSLGGNPMRLRKEEDEIVINEKWKKELAIEDLEVFEALGGKLNRKLGYE